MTSSSVDFLLRRRKGSPPAGSPSIGTETSASATFPRAKTKAHRLVRTLFWRSASTSKYSQGAYKGGLWSRFTKWSRFPRQLSTTVEPGVETNQLAPVYERCKAVDFSALGDDLWPFQTLPFKAPRAQVLTSWRSQHRWRISRKNTYFWGPAQYVYTYIFYFMKHISYAMVLIAMQSSCNGLNQEVFIKMEEKYKRFFWNCSRVSIYRVTCLPSWSSSEIVFSVAAVTQAN